jgi:hypothetical protein
MSAKPIFPSKHYTMSLPSNIPVASRRDFHFPAQNRTGQTASWWPLRPIANVHGSALQVKSHDPSRKRYKKIDLLLQQGFQVLDGSKNSVYI